MPLKLPLKRLFKRPFPCPCIAAGWDWLAPPATKEREREREREREKERESENFCRHWGTGAGETWAWAGGRGSYDKITKSCLKSKKSRLKPQNPVLNPKILSYDPPQVAGL